MQISDEVQTVSTANEDENMDFILEGEENHNNKATQTVGIGKAIVAAEIETRVVRNTLLAESNNGSSGSSSCTRNILHVQNNKIRHFLLNFKNLLLHYYYYTFKFFFVYNVCPHTRPF